MSDESDSQEGSPGDYIYKITIKLMVRSFVNERNARQIELCELNCNSVDEFEDALWGIVFPQIKQEITYSGDTNLYQFEEGEPEKDSMYKFILFQDKTSKKTVGWFEINSPKLQKWSSHDSSRFITCFVQVYGNNIQTKAQFTAANKQLMVPQDADKTGAATTSASKELAKILEEKHQNVLTGPEISWIQYANYVLLKEPHLHESLIDEIPPEVVQYFKLADDNPVQHMNSVRRSVAIGKRVNKGIDQAVTELSEDMDKLIDSLEHCLSLAKVLKGRVVTLEQRANTTAELLEGVEEAVGVQIDQFARSVQSRIVDLEDDDHTFPPDEEDGVII